jgi:bacterioferritin
MHSGETAKMLACFCEKNHGSRMLLEEILKSEEKHLSELQTKVDNIEKFGNQYIVSHRM